MHFVDVWKIVFADADLDVGDLRLVSAGLGNGVPTLLTPANDTLRRAAVERHTLVDLLQASRSILVVIPGVCEDKGLGTLVPGEQVQAWEEVVSTVNVRAGLNAGAYEGVEYQATVRPCCVQQGLQRRLPGVRRV